MSIHTAQGLETELRLVEHGSDSTYLPQKVRRVEQTLEQMFPEQEHQEKRIKEAKSALGLLAYELSEEELVKTITEVEFLTETWLDEFERNIFKGMTLRELLHEKGVTK